MTKGTESQDDLGGLGGGSGGSLRVYNSYELMTADENAMFLLGNTLLCVLHNIYYVSCVMYIHYKIIITPYNIILTPHLGSCQHM